MSIYKKMYYDLFNHVTDAILDLKAAQKAVETMYLAAGDDGDDGTDDDIAAEPDTTGGGNASENDDANRRGK